MRLYTRNFGEIEVNQDKIIKFKEGLPGFEDLQQFILLESSKGTFYYLQSIQDGDICFTIINPYEVKEDYAPIISEEYFEKLGGGESKEFQIYSIVCLKDPIQESTINLAGPLLIHVDNRLGVQVVTEQKMYTTRENLVKLLKERKA